MSVDLRAVPDQHRDTVVGALDAAFDAGEVRGVHTVTGGASGALTYRVESTAGDHLLRVETLTGSIRNPHQYDCMRIAADAGIAPPVRYVDADAGVVVMRFVATRPVADFPGGPPALAAAGGDLLRRLHASAPFAPRGDYLDNLDRMLGYLVRAGRVAPGLLDRHAEGFARIRAALPWDPAAFVPAHNDPNQFNVLFDGDRLWLIDWETAYPNDPAIDVATMAGHLGPTDDLRDALLRAWLGRDADAPTRARTAIAGWLVSLYAGCILLTIVVDPATPTHTDLTAMAPADFGARIERGELVAGTYASTHAYAKIALQSFLDALDTPMFTAALAAVGG